MLAGMLRVIIIIIIRKILHAICRWLAHRIADVSHETIITKPQLVPICRPRKDDRLGWPWAYRALPPGFEPSTSGLRIQRINHYTIAPVKERLNKKINSPFGGFEPSSS